MVDGDLVGHLRPDLGADGVEHEFRRLLELDVAQAERGIHDPGQHRDQFLLVLRGDVQFRVLPEDVGQVGKAGHQVGLGADLVGRLGGRRRFPRGLGSGRLRFLGAGLRLATLLLRELHRGIAHVVGSPLCARLNAADA